MQPSEMVELAAMAAAHGPLLIEGERAISANELADYWSASKGRMQRWAGQLKKPHHDVKAVIGEIFLTEVVTRVWTAIVAAHDGRRGVCEAEPVARSVLQGHLELRSRAAQFLLHGRGISATSAVQLNRLRGQTERYSDLFIGYLSQDYPVISFAANAKRAAQFAVDELKSPHSPDGEAAWAMLLCSLRGGFSSLPRGVSRSTSTRDDVNTSIAVSILGCFDADWLGPSSLFTSLGDCRVRALARRTQQMIDVLLAL